VDRNHNIGTPRIRKPALVVGGNVGVDQSRHSDREPTSDQKTLKPFRNLERDVFLLESSWTNAAWVFSTVSGN
jgi:hypothetical protein